MRDRTMIERTCASNEGGHECKRSQIKLCTSKPVTRLLTCYGFEEKMVVDVYPAVAGFKGYDHNTGCKRLQRKFHGFCTTEEHTMCCHSTTLNRSSWDTHSTNSTKHCDQERSKKSIYMVLKISEDNQGVHNGKHVRELPQMQKCYFEQRSFDKPKRHVVQKCASYDSETAFGSTLNESKYSTTDVSSAESAISMLVDVEIGVDEAGSSTGDGVQVFDDKESVDNASLLDSRRYIEESSFQTLDSDTTLKEKNKTIVPESNRFATCVNSHHDSEQTFDQYVNISKFDICENESVGERIMYNCKYSSANKLKNNTSTRRLNPVQIDVAIEVEAFGSNDVIEIVGLNETDDFNLTLSGNHNDVKEPSMNIHITQQCKMSEFKSISSVPAEKSCMVLPTECCGKLCDGSDAFKESGYLVQVVENTDGKIYCKNGSRNDGITNIIPCLATEHIPEGCKTKKIVKTSEMEDRNMFQSVLEKWKERESVPGRDLLKKSSASDIQVQVQVQVQLVESVKDKQNYNEVKLNSYQDDFEIIDNPFNEYERVDNVIDDQNEASLSGDCNEIEPVADQQCGIKDSFLKGLDTRESDLKKQPSGMCDPHSTELEESPCDSDEHLPEMNVSDLDVLNGNIPFQLGRQLPVDDRPVTDKSKVDWCRDEQKSGMNHIKRNGVQLDSFGKDDEYSVCNSPDLLRGEKSILDSGCLRNADTTLDYLKKGLFLQGESDRIRHQRSRKIGKNILSDVGGLAAEHIVVDDERKGRHEISKSERQVHDTLHDVLGKRSFFRDTLDETTTLVAKPSKSDYIWKNSHTTTYLADRISYQHTPWKGSEMDASFSSLSQTIYPTHKRIGMVDKVSEILKQIERPYISKIGSDIVQNVNNANAENEQKAKLSSNVEPHKSMDEVKRNYFLSSVHSFLNHLKPKSYLPQPIKEERVSQPVSSSSEQSETDEPTSDDEYEEIPKAKSSKNEIVTQFLTSTETTSKFSTFESEPQPLKHENTHHTEGKPIKRKTKKEQNGVSPNLKNKNTKDSWVHRSMGDILEEESEIETQSTLSDVESVMEEKDFDSATSVSRTFIGFRGYPTRLYPIAFYFTCLILVYLFWTVCYFSCTYTSYGFTRNSQAWYCRVYRYASDDNLYSPKGFVPNKSQNPLNPFRHWWD